MVEQNAALALRMADRAYVMEAQATSRCPGARRTCSMPR